MQSENNLVWLDFEMTGLDADKCRIIEAAVIITDKQLNIVAEMESVAISQPKEYLDAMDEWCTTTHGKTGLTQRVLDSEISESQAEELLLEFVKKYVPYKSSPLCGNSIWQDRRFLAKYMPKLDDYCHYRVLDVTSIKLLNDYWSKEKTTFKKKNTHKALDDIRESIAELKHYKENLFKL